MPPRARPSAVPSWERKHVITRVRPSARRWTALFALSAFSLLGCAGEEGGDPPAQEGQGGSQPLSAEAQSLVDQGNTAQRSGRHAEALELFGQALEIHPDHPVPQFGTLMAATSLGDTALARTMREKLAVSDPRLLAMFGEGGAMGGAPHSPSGGETPPQGGLPPGHPMIDVPPADDTLPPPPGARG